MNISPQAALDALTRTDFLMFLRRCLQTVNPDRDYLHNWHIEAMAYEIDRVMRGETNRLIINLPPRYLKSLVFSVIFPAFLLGHYPSRRIVTLSYSKELAAKHAADFRAIVESAWYKRAFPRMQITRSTQDGVHTTKRGYRLVTSVEGGLTGFGGDLIIIDDPQKPVDALSETKRASINNWFTNTLLSRLDNKEDGVIIVVMQRVHMDDLSGYLLNSTTRWRHLCLPAISESEDRIQIGRQEYYERHKGEALHPELESLQTLEDLRQQMSAMDFSAQYQQAPIPIGGNMIKRESLRYYDVAPQRSPRDKIIQSWDTASKTGLQNDYSVCVTALIRDGSYYVLDVTRGRYDYPRLKALAIELADKYRPTDIIIEDSAAGTALGQELRATSSFRYPVRLIKPEGDKSLRLYVNQAKFDAGKVYFDKNAAYLSILETELLAFPAGKTDDIVDALSQTLSYKFSSYTLENVR